MTEEELRTQQTVAEQSANQFAGPNNGSILVNPRPEPTPSQQFDIAIEAKDPKAILGVAQRHVGTDVGFAALKAADVVFKGEQEFNAMTAPIEKAGGLGTPEGNIAATKQAQKLFKQDEPRYKDALIHYLTGDTNMARAMLTGGTTTQSTVTDNDGKLIFVTKNQLGKVVDVEDALGNKLSRQEYDQRYVGRQTYENTLTYKNQDKQQQENITALKESQKVNNANASFQTEAGTKNSRIFDNIAYLRKKGIDFKAKEYADVLKFSSNSLGTADATSKGKTTLDQVQKDINNKEGKSLTKEETNQFGLAGNADIKGAGTAGGGWKWTKTGIEREDKSESKTFGQLKQAQSSENANNEITRNFQQTKNDLIKSLKFQKLDKEDQNRMLAVLEDSEQVSRKQLEMASKYDTPTFLILPSAISIEDQGAAAQVKAIQGMFNSRAMQLYGEYEKKMLADSRGIVPNPKELEAGFTRTKEYKQLLDVAKKASDDVLKEPKTEKPTTAPKATGATPPPATAPTENKPAASRPPPTEPALPKGVPKGSVRSGRVTPNGLPLWKAPDGTLHTED
jgi:hypothetical protein